MGASTKPRAVQLGWSPRDDREILSREELVSEFRLEAVKPSPAFFDERKLSDVNGTYLRALPVAELVARSEQWLCTRWTAITPLVQEGARTPADVYAVVDFLWLPEIKLDEEAWAKLRRQ